MMEPSESFERVSEGLARAASCCKELGKMLDAHEWKNLAKELRKMREKAMTLYYGTPLTEPQILALVSQMELAQKLARQLSVN